MSSIPQNRDENIDYYVAKLNELVKKFSGITAEATFCEAREPGIVAGRDHPGAVTMQKKRASSPLNGNIGECCQVTYVA